MKQDKIYSTKEVAEILHVSKSTIYELLKKGELNSYKVGRNLRFSREDIDLYMNKARNKQEGTVKKTFASQGLLFDNMPAQQGVVLCGQDMMLDVLSNYMRLNGIPCLRAYVGSFESLLSLYQGKVQIASAHLWDYEKDEYNVPFVKRLLPGIHCSVIHLTYRTQGFYVAKGNPKKIRGWEDLNRQDIKIINRECGSGSRVLLDGKLCALNISPDEVNGYNEETTSHLTVASAVGRGDVDLGLGSEKVGRQVDNIDFIPLQKESYDLVIKSDSMESPEIRTLMMIISSKEFQNQFAHAGGYDTTDMGKLIART
ncbi:MAG: substrate-binding domain-containing protein [Anaerovoracaceae bacterium]